MRILVLFTVFVVLCVICTAAQNLTSSNCPVPNGIGTCGQCVRCSEGRICCPNGCGSSCVNIPSGPKGDCPESKPFVYCMVDPCVAKRCPAFPNATCVAHQCGGCKANYTCNGKALSEEECEAIEETRCSPLVDSATKVSFHYDCSTKWDVGSVCTISCPPGTELIGETTVTCEKDRQWSVSLDNTRCQTVSDGPCPPGIPLFRCKISPCYYAKCPAFPDAECRPDYCNGCNFNFYLGKTKLSRRQCIVPDKPICEFLCNLYRCPRNPEALCKTDCYCRTTFYDPVTLDRVSCF